MARNPHPLAPDWLEDPHDANALASGIWPASAERDRHGILHIGGVSAVSLAECFNTPVYIVDQAEACSRAARIATAATAAASRHGIAMHVYYASKAFLCATMARWMDGAGLQLDVCSAGELALALAAGIEPARIALHGSNKSAAEIVTAVRAGVGSLVIDGADEVHRIAAAAAAQKQTVAVRVRVATGVHATTHSFLATAHEDQKFGLAPADVLAVVAAIRAQPELRFVGLHAHIGSQIFDARGFAASAQRLLDLHAQLLTDGPVPELNLGGGFGIAYVPSDGELMPMENLLRQLVDAVVGKCTGLGIPIPDLAIEPGRWIIGPAGITLYTVGAIKNVNVPVEGSASGAVRKYVSVDGGMSDNVRPSLYGARYTARLVNRVSHSEPVLVRVVGKHCESGDTVVEADYLPGDIRSGDLLAVAATGAYCYSLASNYNFATKPAVIAVGDGEAKVMVREETVEELLSRDAALNGSYDRTA